MIYTEGDVIYCTRGDSTETLGNHLEFSFNNIDDTPFNFLPGQTVIFKVYNPKNANEVFIQKEIHIDEICTSIYIPLTEADTTIGDYINKPVTYAYEISINGNATIIGYDPLDGAKPFVLLPEGGNKND